MHAICSLPTRGTRSVYQPCKVGPARLQFQAWFTKKDLVCLPCPAGSNWPGEQFLDAIDEGGGPWAEREGCSMLTAEKAGTNGRDKQAPAVCSE